MKIVIAGGTGFLGTALADALSRGGHDIVLLSRRADSSRGWRTTAWSPDGSTGAWTTALTEAGAIVNLAGESIAGRRWTPAQKKRILESRVLATRSLVSALGEMRPPLPAFISGSAVGYYGSCGDEIVTEDRVAGSDFLADVCRQWEREALGASAAGARVVLVRTGLVLARNGGALPRMLAPFWIGAGGAVGSGRQWWPWIHRDDWVRMMAWAISSTSVEGPINATAPAPETNAAFARALGRAMRRPSLVPAPAFALRLALGEMADALLLSGQRAVPAKAERLGLGFTYPRLDAALESLFA